MIERLALVAGGAAAGAVARYLVGLWVTERLGTAFPWGTLLVNVSGSFALTFLVVLTTERLGMGPGVRLLLGTGVCGGYTTFSAFSLQTLALLQEGRPAAALANVGMSVAACLLAVWAGYFLGSLARA